MTTAALADKLHMTVSIGPFVQRDALHVIARLRYADREELAAAYGPGDQGPSMLAMMTIAPSWIVYAYGEPVALFGYIPRSRYVVEGWSFGTEKMARAMPAMTAYIKAELTRRWNGDGIQACEVRTLSTHRVAHTWLVGMGFRLIGRLPDEGASGEAFDLYQWRRPWTS